MHKTHAKKTALQKTMLKNDEDGRIFVLAIGLLVLVLTLVMLCVGASQVYLEQKRLQRLGDQILVLTASQISTPTYAQSGAVSCQSVQMEKKEAWQRAQSWLETLSTEKTPGLSDISLQEVDFISPTQLRVQLSAHGQVEFLPPIVAQFARIDLRAESVASLKTSVG